MRSDIGIMIGIIALLFSSCSKYSGCDQELDCMDEEPEKGKVKVSISVPTKGDTVHIQLKEGNWSDGTFLFQEPVTSGSAQYNLPLEKTYSARATYTQNGDTTFTYDTGRLVLEDRVNCEKVCYLVETLKLDLEKVSY